jgi:cell division septation protein DedD
LTVLDKHISELLFDHECVIVPDLGGFLTSPAASHIHPTQHTISPPSKKIAFNVFLRHNDGLLANHIVQAENLTYPQAVKEIESYVAYCNSELGAGKKIVIEHVGVLTRDAETNLRFEPFRNVNYLKDSFGLASIQFMPVARNDFDQQVEKQLRDFISLRPSQAQQRRSPLRKKFRLNGMNATLLAGSIFWLCLNLYIVSPDHVNFASLNPFSVSSVDQPAAGESVSSKSEIYTQPSVAKPETVFVKTIVPVEVPAKTSAAPQVRLEDAVSQKVASQNYFIIAGAFNSIVNAMKKEAELKQQGFANAHIIENKDGLKLVCYDGFATRDEAFSELNRMKALNKEGWIFPR